MKQFNMFLKISGEDHISEYSAQCSYYTILSFIPFIMLVITLIQYTGIEPQTLFDVISKNEHPAPFPVSLIERIISSTNANLILDPFMGSGTTAIAASNLGRDFIGIEISPDYIKLAEKRYKEATSQFLLFKGIAK